MHGYSTLDADKPRRSRAAGRYGRQHGGRCCARSNPKVEIRLMATWSRADQTYAAKGAWYGQPIEAMAHDVRAGYDQAAAATPGVKPRDSGRRGVDRARSRPASPTPNPYDGIDAGKVDLWTYDNYHASTTATTWRRWSIFGSVTGLDPRSLGENECSALRAGPVAAAVARAASRWRSTSWPRRALQPAALAMSMPSNRALRPAALTASPSPELAWDLSAAGGWRPGSPVAPWRGRLNRSRIPLATPGLAAGVLDPQGPIAAAERTILLNATVIMLAVIVPVIVLTLAFAWWFRAGNTKAQRRPGLGLFRADRVRRLVDPGAGRAVPGRHRLDQLARSRPARAARRRDGRAARCPGRLARLEMAVHLSRTGVASVNRLVVPGGHADATSSSLRPA